MADKFSVDDILSEYSDKKRHNADENEYTDNVSDFEDNDNPSFENESDIYADEDNSSEDIADVYDDEDASEYEPEHMSDFDEETAVTEANAEKAAEKISSLSKHRMDKVQRNSQNIPPVNRASVKDIKFGLTGKIIPKTEEFDKALIPDDATYEEKSQALYEHRKNKVENFVLDTEDDKEEHDRGESEEKKIVSGQKEFESFDEAPKILNDIMQVKGNLFLRLCVLLFTGIHSVLITVANDFEFPLIKTFDRSISPSAFLFTNTILGLIAIAVSYTVMIAGIRNMIKRNPDCDSIAAIGIFVTVISGIITLFEPESLRSGFYHIYISAAIAGLTFNTLGKMMIIQRTEKNFRYAAGEFDRYAVKKVNPTAAENFTRSMVDGEPQLVTMQKTEFVDDFMKHSYSPDVSDEFANRISPLILIAGIVVALLSFICDKGGSDLTEKTFVALAAFSGVVTMCSSLSLMLVVNVPLSKANETLLQNSSVMLGYSAVEEYADANSVLVEAEQLFPKENVELVNLKLTSVTSLEECILMAASLSCQAGSVLKNPFYKILKGKTEMLYPVESYIYEDGLGLTGWIDNKRILLGTRRLMENHSIDGLPPISKEAEYGKGNIVIYLSVSGIITTLFVVKVTAGVTVKKWMQELENEGVAVVVRTVDSFLTEEFISEIFEIEESSVKLLPFRYHKEYEAETEYTSKVSSSMLCSGHFKSLAMLVVGAKRIKATAGFGIAIQFGGVVLAAVISLIVMLTGSFSQLTPSVVLAYNLVFALISYLFLRKKNI